MQAWWRKLSLPGLCWAAGLAWAVWAVWTVWHVLACPGEFWQLMVGSFWMPRA